MIKNPSVYEINTRVWIRRFADQNKKVRLDEIDKSVWQQYKDMGFDYIWLMGIWKTCPSTIDKYCFEEGLVHEYRNALKDWKREDIIGSPFAIDEYIINPELGNKKTLVNLRETFQEIGLKLILDFIPNHFSADTSLLKDNPDIFLRGDEEAFLNDSHTFYKPEARDGEVFAHGRDPFFPAWQDTIQVNYYSNDAREYMIGILKDLTKVCDGVRCDMAMLNLNNVFRNTWGSLLDRNGLMKPETEFWRIATRDVKELNPDFLFIAEAYWDLEFELQMHGFDYTYDKRLMDRLKDAPVYSIKEHLKADLDYQSKSVRFVENHDELRASANFGKERSLAAAIVTGTTMGMKFFHDGQFEGKRIKLPVQLGREPNEQPAKCYLNFYKRFLDIIKHPVFREGEWQLLDTNIAWENNFTNQNFLAWQWKRNFDTRLIIINYSDAVSQCRVPIDIAGYPEHILFKDILNDHKFINSTDEIFHWGLFVELKPWQAHIFQF